MNDQRRVEIWTMDGWLEVEMSDLKIGDRFRIFESTGEQVILTAGGDLEGIVYRPPVVGEYGTYEVEVYGYDKKMRKPSKERGPEDDEVGIEYYDVE